MKITITGSLGNISRTLIEKTVAGGHQVKVISSDPGKAKAIEQLGAKPLIGSLEDPEFLSMSFRDLSAVYTMVPPNFSAPDYFAFSEVIHSNYAHAIQENEIKYVVNLSSIGVALAGREPIEGYFNLEQILDSIPGLNIVHLRPGMFYSNFYGSVDLIKYREIIGHNLASTVKMPMTHPGDIAREAFRYLNQLSFQDSKIHYVISDVKTGAEIAEIIGQKSNKSIHWV
ncbi:uncharacterized protein YbjT (DUF2867 family) [Algoriphagus sp. 4150]|uniref:NAD(P)H-binding protein n=1 Tax=Algoriphagus sp. 4150 TaxID=2817756 RepID=UPI00286722E9|nr:NAD(P)H-binding protein [Algoriphagus sp. 4150]MDR7131467.1 uncharacterized protein YbjT (DUF2867 family) [Algoriphagus sp. 4150]